MIMKEKVKHYEGRDVGGLVFPKVIGELKFLDFNLPVIKKPNFFHLTMLFLFFGITWKKYND